MANTPRLPKGLVLGHINVSSLRNKTHELYSFIQSNKIDILAVCETHLDSSFADGEVTVDGFSIYRKDRNEFGGGVALLIRDHFPAKLRLDLMDNDIEAIWLQVHLPHLKPILVGCCYRAPSAKVECLHDICAMMDKASEENREMYVLGDYNVDWLSNKCPSKNILKSNADTCGLAQLVTQPTRISVNQAGAKTAKCIDHIYTNNPALCSKSVSIPVGFSDHNAVAITRTTRLPKARPKIICSRSYKRFNEDTFLAELQTIQWDDLHIINDAEVALKMFMDHFMNVVNRHAPIRKFTVKSKCAPWLDDELKQMMQLRDEAKNVAVLSNSFDDKLAYNKLRNQVTKVNRYKKKAYYQQRISDCGHDSKKLWNTLNEIMGKRKGQTSFVETDGVYLTRPQQISNYFNDFFIEKIARLRGNIDSTVLSDSENLIKEIIMKDKMCSFEFTQVELRLVENLLRTLPLDGPAGSDLIDSKLLKIGAPYISRPICHIYNQCILNGVWPQSWKEGKILPLPKDKKLPFNGPNSRPISLLPVLSKLLEKLVFEQVQRYFTENSLTTEFQHAYRAGHSTCTAMLQMSDNWLASIDNSMFVGSVSIDCSAAFDLIDYDLLTDKLECYGFRPSAILMMRSYLTSRSQRCYFNGTYSNRKNVDCGIPQGSCLGPLLYSIFTNDLPLAVKRASLTMYADDSTLYYAASTCSELNQVLTLELNRIYDWIKANKLVLNPSKTVAMIFGSTPKLAQEPKLNLIIDGQHIQQVKKAKLLGLWLDGELSWTNHIKHIIAKMGAGIGAARKCATFLPPALLNQVVCSLVLCHLDYCTGVWSSASKGLIKKLQIMQNKGARLVLGCSPRANIVEMHKKLKWLSVEKRLTASMLMFFHKVIQTQRPQFIFRTIGYRADIHSHNTRAAMRGQMTLPLPKSESLKRTFYYRTVMKWNDLPYNISVCKSTASFKRSLKSHLSEPNN